MPRLLSVNVGLRRDIASGKGKPSTPPFGRRRFRAGAWCDGSTSMATAKEIWRGMAANTGQSLSTRLPRISIGKSGWSRRVHLWVVRGEFTVEASRNLSAGAYS